MDEAVPKFIRHSDSEAARHPNYLLVTTVPWPSAKGSFHTTIEWHSNGATQAGRGAGDGMQRSPSKAETTPRVRTLVEREPLNAAQAREKAAALARQHAVPVVLTVVR
jgi:hypothetical protein